MRSQFLKRAALGRSHPVGSGSLAGRFYASPASPGQSSNVRNPISSNPESQSINVSRGKEARRSDNPDSRSVQPPISSQRGPTSEAHEGEEQTSSDSHIKNDPNLTTEEKQKRVKQEEQRPLGPEDSQ